MGIYNFISLLGMFILVFLAWCLSSNRREVNWHVVVWGIGLQFLMAWFLFIFPLGVKCFLIINEAVVKVMDSASAGTRFVFGVLALPPGTSNEWGERSVGFILAFQALPTIIFFSALMAIFYYYNILPRFIKAFAYLFTKLMKVSGAESLCTASNIFVGVESILTVKPYVKDMTRSELCTVLTAGMATISSSVLAIYVFSLQKYFPTIAGHLISASFLSAPAALLMSKVLLPETEKPRTLGEDIDCYVERDSNLFEAVIKASNLGVQLIIGIVALLMAVLGLVALLDQCIGFIGTQINHFVHIQFVWSLKNILGILFYPLTVILGIPVSDVPIASQLIGQRVVLTELFSYQELAGLIQKGVLTDPRSIVIITYALCGFAHVASMAIFIGGITAIVPEKTKVLSQIGFRALVAATLACLMTACVAGVFFVNGSSFLNH